MASSTLKVGRHLQLELGHFSGRHQTGMSLGADKIFQDRTLNTNRYLPR